MIATLLIRLLAIAILLAVLGLTLGPVGWRHIDLVPAPWDRSLAFAILAFLGCLAVPRRPALVAIGLILLIIVLELAQGLSLERHADYEHALQKAFGAAVGFCLGFIAASLLTKPAAPRRPPRLR